MLTAATFAKLSLPLRNPNLRLATSCHLPPPPMPPSSSSLIAGYAKSNRSSCKTCSKNIEAKTLRLGVVTKDKDKKFDMTKWHHLHCLSFNSLSVDSAESIRGFESLKSDDQEDLKKVVDNRAEVKDKGEQSEIVASEKKQSNKRKKKSDDQEDLKKLVDNSAEVKDKGEQSEIVAAEKKQSNKRKGKVIQTDEGEQTEIAAAENKQSNKKRKLVDDDEEIEIALEVSHIKDKYKDATLVPQWRAFHTIIFLEKDDGLRDSSKIAAFDFDGCLANTNVKISGADKWSLMYPSIPDKLQKLYNDGFKLVIFTNESNIERWTNKRQKAVDSKVGRLNNFIKLVNVPIQVFIACGFDKNGKKDAYRKPRPGMWRVMEKHFNSGIAIDMDNSFYVGDAAGRVNDHSDADIKFAQAVGLKFYLPEEFFDAKD